MVEGGNLAPLRITLSVVPKVYGIECIGWCKISSHHSHDNNALIRQVRYRTRPFWSLGFVKNAAPVNGLPLDTIGSYRVWGGGEGGGVQKSGVMENRMEMG